MFTIEDSVISICCQEKSVHYRFFLFPFLLMSKVFLFCSHSMPCSKLVEIECSKCKLSPDCSDLLWQTDGLRLRMERLGHKSTSALVRQLRADQNLTVRRIQRSMPHCKSELAARKVYDYVEAYRKDKGLAEEFDYQSRQIVTWSDQ